MKYFWKCYSRKKSSSYEYQLHIWDALRDLALLVQFKNREKHSWRSVTFNASHILIMKIAITPHWGKKRFHIIVVRKNSDAFLGPCGTVAETFKLLKSFIIDVWICMIFSRITLFAQLSSGAAPVETQKWETWTNVGTH